MIYLLQALRSVWKDSQTSRPLSLHQLNDIFSVTTANREKPVPVSMPPVLPVVLSVWPLLTRSEGGAGAILHEFGVTKLLRMSMSVVGRRWLNHPLLWRRWASSACPHGWEAVHASGESTEVAGC
jgi:hypothetical protein